MPICNICQSTSFSSFRGRPAEKCDQCGALARHRVAVEVFERHLFPILTENKDARILHLAPEAALYPLLKPKLGGGYLTADADPRLYPHAPCLKLYFPGDFALFPDGYFDAILHNHVLEHIPGHYGDHLRGFTRMLAPGGKMIFSFPGPYKGQATMEGGEHLATDAERLEKFLQEDHYKLIGDDFYETLSLLPDGHQLEEGVSEGRRAELSVRPKKAPFFVWQRKSHEVG